jgi:hypothetical protein
MTDTLVSILVAPQLFSKSPLSALCKFDITLIKQIKSSDHTDNFKKLFISRRIHHFGRFK